MTDERAEPLAALPALRSEDLLQGAREVLILHAGETYRLRVTSNCKLILTK
jgi:hemin uptake protein HemP